MERIEFLRKGFVNTIFTNTRIIQNKLDEFCGDTENTIEEFPNDNHFVVTMVKKPYLKPQGTQKYMFTIYNNPNGFAHIADVIELFD